MLYFFIADAILILTLCMACAATNQSKLETAQCVREHAARKRKRRDLASRGLLDLPDVTEMY